ncbi:MAG: recombinase family protein [Sneathiella sp.]
MTSLYPSLLAVIYGRVSSVKQMAEGDGLESQLATCREFARSKGLMVEKEFSEVASGRLDTRKGMTELISYLRRSKGVKKAVIIDDISRIARDMGAYLKIKKEITDAGGSLVSPRHPYGESADEVLLEMLLAVMADHFSRKNAETSKDRTLGRMLNRYYAYSRLPRGYCYESSGKKGNKEVIRNEPDASIISELLTGFAAGRFQSIGEAKIFLENNPTFMQNAKKNTLSYTFVGDILRNRLYAGFYVVKTDGFPLVEGKHPKLISFSEHQAILERLEGRAVARVRKDVSSDFPLRGFVLCEACETLMTSNWSEGRAKPYPYYICRRRGCARYGKSIRREKIEAAFEDVLRRIQPEPSFMRIFSQMLQDAWKLRGRKDSQSSKDRKKRISEINRKIDLTMDRYVENVSDVVTSALERKLEKLHSDRACEEQKATRASDTTSNFSDVFEPAAPILEKPLKIWKKSTLEWRQAMIRMIFAQPAVYSRKDGFRTVNLTLPFRALADCCASEYGLVPHTYPR